MKGAGAAARINNPGFRSINICQSITFIVMNLALVIPTGIVLFQKGENDQCSANNDSSSYESENCVTCIPESRQGDQVDVTMRFTNILSIYFAIFIIGLVRGILLLLAALTRVGPLAMLYQCLGLNDCLAFAALIIIHVFRFQPSGKFCSGDYFDKE